MEPQAPGTTVYPVWQHDTAGLVGTAGVQLIRDADATVVVARTTAGIVALSAKIYRGTLVMPTTEGEYTILWDDGAGRTAVEDVRVAYSALTAGPTGTLSLTELRQHVETGLEDEPLQRLLDEAYATVIGRFGDDTAQTVTLNGGSWTKYLFLPRPALSITSATELQTDRTLLQVVDPASYYLHPGGKRLERISTDGWGEYPGYWAPVVDVVYVPKAEAETRNRTVIDLVRLAVQHNALMNERVGDYSSTSVEYTRERERILMGLVNNRGLRFA